MIFGGSFDFSVLDFAGGGAVHMAGGFSGLAGLYWFGFRNQFVDPQTRMASSNPAKLMPRFEKDEQGVWRANVLPQFKPLLGALGTFILYFGWYGFNGGSIILIHSGGASIGGAFGRVFIVMTLAASTCALTSLLIGRFENRNEIFYKWNLNDVLNGILAGLVVITPAAGFVSAWAGCIMGILGAFCWKFFSNLLAHPKVRFDDPVDAFAVHGSAGALGLFLTGLFAQPEFMLQVNPNSPWGGAFYTSSNGLAVRLGAQLIAIIVVAAWAFFWNFLLFGAFYYFDRNRGKDAYFIVRGTTSTGLSAGGTEIKQEEDRFNAAPLTGFVDPLADSGNQKPAGEPSGAWAGANNDTVVELESFEM